MFKIRNSCFETNSSSMDRYDDYDRGPDHSHGRQTIRIILKWAENVPDVRIDEIIDSIDHIEEDIFDILSSLMEDADDFEISSIDYTDITVTADVRANIRVISPGYAGDRYCPPEGPELEFDYNGFPFKNEECPARNKTKEELLKLFHNQGWTEITGIEHVYGDELDDNDLYDNISY